LHQARLARRSLGDVVAVAKARRAVDEERAEHRGRSRVGVLSVVAADDEHRQAQHVGQQDELLALVVGDVTRPGQEVDPGEPLVFGQVDFGGERVQM
jgi:hypothetical protein